MAAIEPFCNLIGINQHDLSKEEYVYLEAEILRFIFEEIKEFFREKYKDYFRLMKFTVEMENTMLENEFVYLIVKDILATNEYTIQGIANYTGMHEDVVYEVASGCNKNPSAIFFLRIMNLHKVARREFYEVLIKKFRERNHPF